MVAFWHWRAIGSSTSDDCVSRPRCSLIRNQWNGRGRLVVEALPNFALYIRNGLDHNYSKTPGFEPAGSSSRGIGRRLTTRPSQVAGVRRPATSTPGALSATPSGLSEIAEDDEEPTPRPSCRAQPISEKCKPCRLGGTTCNRQRPCNNRACRQDPSLCVD